MTEKRTEKPKGICRFCGVWLLLNKDGSVRAHGGVAVNRCQGSRQLPVDWAVSS